MPLAGTGCEQGGCEGEVALSKMTVLTFFYAGLALGVDRPCSCALGDLCRLCCVAGGSLSPSLLLSSLRSVSRRCPPAPCCRCNRDRRCAPSSSLSSPSALMFAVGASPAPVVALVVVVVAIIAFGPRRRWCVDEGGDGVWTRGKGDGVAVAVAFQSEFERTCRPSRASPKLTRLGQRVRTVARDESRRGNGRVPVPHQRGQR